MANPQPVPFVRFSKELLEAFLMNPPATVAAGQLWLWVLLNTWGNFGKDETPVRSVREIARAVGLSKSVTHRDLEALVRARRLKMGDKGGYSIQKDYDLWREDPKPRKRQFVVQIPLGIDVPACPPGGDKAVPQLGTKPSPSWGQKRPAGGDSAVPQLGTPIRNETTVENREGARKRAAPTSSQLPNDKKDTARNRAELGHEDFAPEDHPDFKRLTFKLQDELLTTWKDAREAARKAAACRKGCGRPRASAAWPYCRPCTVCNVCDGGADGVRKFQTGGGGVICTVCADDIK